jgi:hypothetical protein
MEPKALVKESNLISPSLLYKKEAQLTTSYSSIGTGISKVMPPQIDLWQLLTLLRYNRKSRNRRIKKQRRYEVPSTSVPNVFGYQL